MAQFALMLIKLSSQNCSLQCAPIVNCKNEYLGLALGEETADSSRLYRLGVTQAQKAKVSGDERPRLRAS